MIDLRDMELLVALSRHRHFAKAASACGISQPAFSMRIRNLEDRYDISIVKRGNRFQGFTEEGDMLLEHARRFLADAEALEQELKSARGEVTGRLTLGVIPTALAFATRLTIRLGEVHPGVQTRVMSTSSLAILQGIEDGTLDAGVTYDDGVSPDLLFKLPLYTERYVLLCPTAMAQKGATEISWAEAAEVPLTLLEPQMQNRRIVDRMFREIGAEPRILAETNAITASVILAEKGYSATIAPEVLVETMGEFPGTVVLRLTKPPLEKAICLVTAPRNPARPTVEALKRVCEDASNKP